ncbi:MAG: DUF3313 domain-containing protein, partial [Desulfobacterales bacterium]|nr:DUF3313 domain-containing protein [Desulfobacterales bacterium]
MQRVMRLNILCIAFLALVFATGCATHKSAEKYSGFLEDYTKLEPLEDGSGAERYQKTDVDLSKYDKLLVDRILIWFKEDSEYKGIDPTELKGLTDYFYEAIRKEFGDEEFATEPGPDVLRLRIAVTEIVPTKPGVSVLIFCTPYAWVADFADNQTKGSSYVGAAGVEMEVLDSMTSERLAAYVETKIGDKYKFDFEKKLGEAAKESLASYGKAYTTWGYVKQAFDYWAKKIHDRWEEIQGRAVASEMPGALAVETTTISGVVTAVDRKELLVSIKGPGGGIVELDAKDARNLDQVEVGDKVEVKYIESVVLAAVRSGSAP